MQCCSVRSQCLRAARSAAMGRLSNSTGWDRRAASVPCRSQDVSKDDAPSAGVVDKPATESDQTVTAGSTDINKDLSKFVRSTATTFAPRASGAVKNPAYKGSVLYDIFGWQAWICMALGGALSYNLLFPSDEPDIWRLMGMWSIWMFTIPSLRARECTAQEKDALNLLFLAIPLLNVTLPFVWKSFGFIYTADVVLMAAVYYWKLSAPAEDSSSA